MKTIIPFIAGILAISSWEELKTNDVSEIAMGLIKEVIEEVSPTIRNEQQNALTSNEKKAVGRYFETPSLQEVYPGIGRALSREES